MSRPNTYVKINLRNLIHNFHTIRNLTPDKTVLCIVKADAYGHGAAQCSRALQESGAEYFAVSSFNEAKELREACICKPILVLGYISEKDIAESLTYQLTYTVYSITFAKQLDECAKSAGIKAKIHIKINTGMNRLGFSGKENCLKKIKQIAEMENLIIEGLFSHFSSADEEDLSYTRGQYQQFVEIVEEVKKTGIDIPLIHLSNSAGIAAYEKDVTTAIRPGIILYGIHPSSVVEQNHKMPLKVVMTFGARVASISVVEDGAAVSYGRKYHAQGKRKLAVISAGYADGYFRALSNKGEVLIKGCRAKITGTICMDMFMADITDIEHVKVGDEVILFGEDLPVSELAEKIGTIPYELTCSMSKRVKRLY